MRKLLVVTLYTALIGVVNPSWANGLDTTALLELREGDMRKLAIHETPRDRIEQPFETIEGDPIDITAYQGKVILMNFWATWCAPCRAEMPMLDAINAELGGEAFEVVTIAVGRNPEEKIDAFFDEINVQTLPRHRDNAMRFSRAHGALGLPVTLILDPQGREIARMQGEADWSSDNAKAIINAIIATYDAAQ